MYSSYDLSSFAWFISGDGKKGIRRCVPENPDAPNPSTQRHRFQYRTGVAQKVFLLDHFPRKFRDEPV
jgi:hypothetical protein